jgi:microcystin-dependent protein
MPTDSNGVYSLPSGYEAVTGEIIQASQHNPPLEDLAQAMSQRVMRSGVTPMTGPLKNSDGAASAPSITFNSAIGTGLYKTTDGIGVAVNGVQVAELTAGGMTKGVRNIGELIIWSGATPPPRFIFPVGNTLSRATYPDLWAFAQQQITAGSTFYNNGDGSTTFGIGDLRGRTVAAPDNMGGSSADRLVNGSGSVGNMASVRHTVGGAGGEAAHSLTASEAPTITSTTDFAFGISVVSNNNNVVLGSPIVVNLEAQVSQVTVLAPGANSSGITSQGTVPRIPATSNNTGSQVHNNVQPTILLNYALYTGV